MPFCATIRPVRGIGSTTRPAHTGVDEARVAGEFVAPPGAALTDGTVAAGVREARAVMRRGVGRVTAAVAVMVASLGTVAGGLVANAAAGQTRWPGLLDLGRTHPFATLAVLAAINVPFQVWLWWSGRAPGHTSAVYPPPARNAISEAAAPARALDPGPDERADAAARRSASGASQTGTATNSSAIPGRSTPSRGHPTGGSPAGPTTRRYGSGERTVPWSVPSPATAARYAWWPGPRTGPCWPPAPVTGRYGSGRPTVTAATNWSATPAR